VFEQPQSKTMVLSSSPRSAQAGRIAQGREKYEYKVPTPPKSEKNPILQTMVKQIEEEKSEK
jgi:hypothetical protein